MKNRILKHLRANQTRFAYYAWGFALGLAAAKLIDATYGSTEK